jgi:hypothetical protein
VRGTTAPLAWVVHDVRMAPKKTTEADPGDEPDRLVRQKRGSYRTADERFEVEQADVGWFVVDSQQSNELGLPLTHGPFATLKAVQEALPGARKTTPMPARKPGAAPKARSRAKAGPEQPKPPPPSWIDRLPDAEARTVRTLIRALDREGLPEAEQLVRRDREGIGPEIASRLIATRLDALVDDLPAARQDDARELVRRVAEILSAEGAKASGPLPRWLLVEVGPGDEPPNRRIIIR